MLTELSFILFIIISNVSTLIYVFKFYDKFDSLRIEIITNSTKNLQNIK
jgi:hypothetical protein